MTRPVALVTGGRRGIGAECALALARAGFDVAFTDIVDDDAVVSTLGGIESAGARGLFVQHDLAAVETHAGLIDTVVRRFGRLDVLVNNAGIGSVVRGDILDLVPTNFDRIIDVNLRGTLFLSIAAAKWMLASPAANRAIITITSVSAALASPERADYCVSKAGLSMAMRNLALRLAAHDTGVFEVRPGVIATDMTAGVAAKYDARIADGLVPAMRWGKPKDIASVVAGLASGAFGFATGSVIDVDGGLSIGRL